jgi:vanillate O-demethylase ferredoxin subunit
MLRSAANRRQSFQFIYSGRTLESMAYADAAMALAGSAGTLHLSGEPPTEHLDLRQLLSGLPEGTGVYVCGPPGMVNATYAAAAAVGLASTQVHSEQFGALRGEHDSAFEVLFERSGKRVIVGADTTILDAAEAVGIALLSDCRRGECGLCPLPVIQADSPIEHRDRYLTEEEKALDRTLCLCVSRLPGGTLILDA